MKPYPFELLNHFTVPCTYLLLLRWRPGCFSLRPIDAIKLPQAAINCAECTRMRLSVKRAFSPAVSKNNDFSSIKPVQWKNADFPNADFVLGCPQLQANTGFATNVAQAEMFVSPVRFSAHNRIIFRRKPALNSLRGAKSRKDCCSRRSKVASWKGQLSSGCRKRFPAHSENVGFSLRAPNRRRRS